MCIGFSEPAEPSGLFGVAALAAASALASLSQLASLADASSSFAKLQGILLIKFKMENLCHALNIGKTQKMTDNFLENGN